MYVNTNEQIVLKLDKLRWLSGIYTAHQQNVFSPAPSKTWDVRDDAGLRSGVRPDQRRRLTPSADGRHDYVAR